MSELPIPLTQHIGNSATRVERVRALKDYYSRFLCEEGQDGTEFDDMVYDCLGWVEKHACGMGEAKRDDGAVSEQTGPSGRTPNTFLFEPIGPMREDPLNMPCPECGNGPVVYEEGCMKCHLCGYSECG